MAKGEIDQAYIIMSSKTGYPYLGDGNESYVFTRARDAKLFVEKTPDTIAEGPKYFKISDLMSQCYAAGADRISLYVGSKNEVFPLTENLVERAYYNHTLNRVYAKLKQTKHKKSLKYFAKERFILPAKIDNENNSVSILYAVAQIEDGTFLYVAFTDLDEYNIWASHVHGWSPLEVDYKTLWRIAKHHGALINLYGSRFVLKREYMEYIQEECGNDNSEDEESD